MVSLLTFIVLALVALGVAFFNSVPPAARRALRLMAAVLLVAGVVAGSWVSIDDDEVGIVYQERLGKRLPIGQTIAEAGQRGPHLSVLQPGFSFRYLPFFYRVQIDKVVAIPAGRIGIVTANDGESLAADEIVAPNWRHPDPKISNPAGMVTAESFMEKIQENGNTRIRGFAGLQKMVLPAGTYRINTALFEVAIQPTLEVRPGSVAVINSHIGPRAPADGKPVEWVNGMPLVPRDYRGIWTEVLAAGSYPELKPGAQGPTRGKSGQRIYDFYAIVPNQTGRGPVTKAGGPAPMSSAAVEAPVTVRSKDGFLLPIDVRLHCTVTAEQAPRLVALVGNPDGPSDDPQHPVCGQHQVAVAASQRRPDRFVGDEVGDE